MPTRLFVLVYVASPLDYARYRHTALFFEFAAGTTTLIHIRGAYGIFSLEEKTHYDPEASRSLAGKIPVAELPDSISTASIKSTVISTPIKNSDREWNCQNWVGDALSRLVKHGFLDPERRITGFNKMIDVCMEAKDEENRGVSFGT
jgi:hypothetical protein